MKEGVLVVDTASSTPAFPLAMEILLMPGLGQREEGGVDLSADCDVCEPAGPVTEFHPVTIKNEHASYMYMYMNRHKYTNVHTGVVPKLQHASMAFDIQGMT